MSEQINFKRSENMLKEVREGINMYGKFYGSLKGWELVTIDTLNNKLYVTNKSGQCTVYNNVHGTFGFGTSL